MKPIANQELLWKKVDKVLWEDWDPIGVNDYGGPDDEYRSYVPAVYKLLVQGESLEIIAQKLDELATKEMGMSPDKDHSKMVAEKLIAVLKKHLSE